MGDHEHARFLCQTANGGLNIDPKRGTTNKVNSCAYLDIIGKLSFLDLPRSRIDNELSGISRALFINNVNMAELRLAIVCRSRVNSVHSWTM